MVRIGVLSDTHLRHPTDYFKKFIEDNFGEMDMIVHAGDMVSLEVYQFLSAFNLKAVQGNMDDMELKSILPEKIVFEVERLKLGLIHGQGAPFGIEDFVIKHFENLDEPLDVIIYGHSHIPKISKRGNLYLFNPGSFRKPYTPPGTVGVLKVVEGKVTFDHLPVVGT
ncbi:MAG: YfcE family phosphodiesterase [Deltaproteobacteria bacterium]|nr:YfcE family phosphodiesterase [Deltaproteobacteria bacterium]